MHHIVRKRRERNAVTITEAAAYCGVSVGSLMWHRMKGRIPRGEIPIDGYSFYSDQQLGILKSFFSNRGIYEHMT